MPTTCSIPGCRTNRSRSFANFSVFSFPKDSTRRTQWEWAIRQLYDPNYTFKEGHKICSRHFEDELIEKEHRAVRDDGSLLVLPRKALTLIDSAVPTLFDFLPDPLPEALLRRRLPIANLETLREEFDTKLREEIVGLNVNYNYELPAFSIFKVLINEDYEPQIIFSITLNEDLVATVRHSTAAETDVTQILGESCICDDWSKLRRLLRLLINDYPPEKKRKHDRIISEDDVLVLEVSDDGHIKLGEFRPDSDDD
uniref:THAP domain-containing protein 2 n=1 Tax=Lygus hesperus TaxID=30085 RepID=A0A0A9YRX4_LYGHE